MTSDVESVTASRRRQGTLLLAAFIGGAAWLLWSLHDSFLLAALVAAAGVLWSSRDRKSWVLASVMVAIGLYWSSVDANECSTWWRGRIIYEKLIGNLPYIGWDQIQHEAFSPCHTFYKAESQLLKTIEPLGQKVVNGRNWELYQTGLGPFWIAAPGRDLLAWLVWEITMQHDYESGGVAIRPGDTVVDCGAHVGVFTRYALSRGAGRVVSIEPEPGNIAMLEANLASEIASGRVILVKAGVWDQKTYLALSHSETNSAADSFVRTVPASFKEEGLPVLPLDDIVQQLGLDRVDFIKMDIEGAERRALEGAWRTIGRFRPRMAICSYHMRDDPDVIPAVVQSAVPSYRIHAKDYERGKYRLITKVLFFD